MIAAWAFGIKFAGHYWKEDKMGDVISAIGAVIDLYNKEAGKQAAAKREATRNGGDGSCKEG